jgi:RNA polymerase sigma factor (sigma-70 family)
MILDEACFLRRSEAGTDVSDDALSALAQMDERKCRIIELRFFGGLSVEETAQAVGVSVATVGREQRLAEAWLHRELGATGSA